MVCYKNGMMAVCQALVEFGPGGPWHVEGSRVLAGERTLAVTDNPCVADAIAYLPDLAREVVVREDDMDEEERRAAYEEATKLVTIYEKLQAAAQRLMTQMEDIKPARLKALGLDYADMIDVLNELDKV